jgi:transmembrane sensor
MAMYRWRVAFVVGSAAVALLITFLTLTRASDANTDYVYSTDVGGFARTSLVDGSIVELNTASRISVRIADAARKIVFMQGEASFQAAQDRRRRLW